MKYIRFIVAFVLCITAALASMPVFAIDSSTNTSYTVNDNNKKVSIPETYSFERVIRGVYSGLQMTNPSDIYIHNNEFLYVADTGNNRILKFDLVGNLISIFDNSGEKGLISPKSICVDSKDNLYIADSGNQRITVLDSMGNFVKEYKKPESDLISDTLIFEPSKICLNKNGLLYVLVGKEFMIIDEENNFLGFLGSSEVPFSLKNLFIRLFASDEQKKLITKVQPDQYNNFTVSGEMVYAVSYGTKDQIKKISSVGDNIYPTGEYGEYSYNQNNQIVRPNFTDIAVSSDGIIFASELNSSNIYQYGQNGELLSVFGGEGSGEGKFLSPAAIEVDKNGYVYVLDAGYGNIQVLKPTLFINMIIEASCSYENGKYDLAYDKWQEVLGIHDSYPIGLNTVAKILYKNKQYGEALKYAKLAGNQELYGKINAKYRHAFLSENFALLCLVAIVVVLLAVVFIMRFKKYADKKNREMIFGKEKI